MQNLLTGALVALSMLLPHGLSVSFDEQDPYPGHPLVDNYAAGQNCPDTGPPPPSGYHWAYDIECIATAAQAHEDGWRAGHTQYTSTRDAIQAKLTNAQAHLASLQLLIQSSPPAQVPMYQAAITRQEGVIAGLEASLAANETAWSGTQASLKAAFYESIDDCCIQVPNG
jgi:hypothetical protein